MRTLNLSACISIVHFDFDAFRGLSCLPIRLHSIVVGQLMMVMLIYENVVLRNWYDIYIF